MPRPQTKKDLLEAAQSQYEKLNQLLDSLTDKELNTPYDFSNDPKKTEAHWSRDKNTRDVIMHLYEWHQLALNWIADNKKGIAKPFLMEGYTWRTYGDMNRVFWSECQNISLDKARELFNQSHSETMSVIESMSNEELFSKGIFDWAGSNTIGAYLVSTTSSHYDWAMKKIKAHRKNVNA